jgi:VWFA-related protein
MRLVPLVVAPLLVALTGPGSSPQDRTQEAPHTLSPAEATRVTVDVVVRDSQGQPVTDLATADFEVREDGVPQTIEQFLLIRQRAAEHAGRPGEPIGGAAGAPAGQEASADARPAALPLSPVPPAHATIALVFDRLSTEGRVAARQAALDFLEHDWRSDDVVGVFSVEGSLVVLQDFTADAPLVRGAVEAIGQHAAHAGVPLIDQMTAAADARVAANDAMASAMGSGGGPGAVGAYQQAKWLGMLQSIADAFGQLERDEHGFATTHAREELRVDRRR